MMETSNGIVTTWTSYLLIKNIKITSWNFCKTERQR